MRNLKTYELFDPETHTEENNSIIDRIYEMASELSAAKIIDNKVLQIKNSQVVGVIIFWEGSDNPYYRNGEYPEYLRVIEVNEAYGNIDDYEMDNIRLITVDQEGDFDENELIMEMRNNLNAGF